MLNALAVDILAAWFSRRLIVSIGFAISFGSFCLYLANGRVTEELQCLQSAAHEAEHCIAEAHSRAQEAAAHVQDALCKAAEEASHASRLR